MKIEKLAANERLTKFYKLFKIEDNKRWYANPITKSNLLRLCVSQSYQKDLLAETYGVTHLSLYKLYLKPAEKYYWPSMFADIKRFVHRCDVCQRTLAGPTTNNLLGRLEIPQSRFPSISIDFDTRFPPSGKTDMVLVVVDRLTKYSHFLPVRKTITGYSTAMILINEVFRLHGIPTEIVSDRNVRFQSVMYQSIMDKLGTKLKMSTANHPETNGLTERTIKTLTGMLRRYCFNQLSSWRKFLPMVEFAYNTSYHHSIRCTPFFEDHGYEASVPFYGRRFSKGHVTPTEEYLKAAQAVLHQTKEYLVQQQNRSQVIAGVKSLLILESGCFSTEMLILGADGLYQKNHPVYLGPYKVVKRVGESAVELDLPSITKQNRVINVRWLKLYQEADVVYPKEPPRNEIEATSRADEITAIAGIAKGYLHVVWQDCKPEHGTPISFDFFRTKVPTNVRNALTEQINYLKRTGLFSKREEV